MPACSETSPHCTGGFMIKPTVSLGSNSLCNEGRGAGGWPKGGRCAGSRRRFFNRGWRGLKAAARIFAMIFRIATTNGFASTRFSTAIPRFASKNGCRTIGRRPPSHGPSSRPSDSLSDLALRAGHDSGRTPQTPGKFHKRMYSLAAQETSISKGGRLNAADARCRREVADC